jgi:RimJ/RimL family protein N-acetyltransferase
VSSFPVDRAHPPSRVVYRDATRHLTLRPWTLADVDALVEAVNASLSDLRAFMPWAHVPVTREVQYAHVVKSQAEYHAGRDFGFGMFSTTGEVIGGLGLHPRVPLNPRGLDVGYWCHTAHAGRGWTTLAVRMATVLAFDRFDCDRLQVSHDEANVASGRVVDKCGFTFEGLVSNILAAVPDDLKAGGYRGTRRHRLYALLPQDLPRLDWIAGVRAAMTIDDALHAGPRGTTPG